MEVSRLTWQPAGLTYPISGERIVGDRPGPHVWITTGIHGAEYLGIETGKRLAKRLAETSFSGTVTILHAVNGRAFAEGVARLVPEDGKNPNRMFPGKADGTAAEALAAWLMESIVTAADFYIDMHCGDLLEDLTPLVFYPKNSTSEIIRKTEQILQRSGFPYAVGSYSTNGTHTNVAMKGVPAILAEYGCHGLWTEEEVAGYMDCIWRILAALDMVDVASETKPTRFMAAVDETYSAHFGYWYPAKRAGEVVEKGALLGRVTDAYGNELARYTAPNTSILMYQHIGLGVDEGHFLFALSAI